ncbi:hypothetical protein HOR96_gp04 [Agrobacterium phage Atu_ph02]|uniref:Uncharacterized protein n=1 Tax=Agrobacterium phage Atu_ph02 TaxID=2024261 RepID=A0A2L0UYZ6_9CAUD|nr:hypothetical protein HOR96_gp04 [Agrobacterium phage Atu_ph02]AUZ94730.1 hypothetical protein [Agrobacterium phage Atu_ph02]
MTTQLQHADRIRHMVDWFMQDVTPTGRNPKLQNYLEDVCGFGVLGVGNFSIVIKHPENPDLVIKITVGDLTGMGSDHMDDGYLDYVIACMRQPKSKYLPEFHAAVVGKKCVVIVMRRYRSAYEARPGVDSTARTAFLDGTAFACKCQSVRNVLDALGRANDLHEANYMYAPDEHCYVITDPYCTKRRVSVPAERFIDKKGHVVIDVQVAPPIADLYLQELRDAFLVPPEWMNFHAVNRHVQRGPNMQQLPRDAPAFRKVFDKERQKWMVVDDKRAFVDRTGGGTAVRPQEEDQVLRERAEHDHPAQPVRVQGALLPEQGARRVQTARPAELESIGAKAVRQLADEAAKLAGFAPGLLLVDTASEHAMAAEVQHQLRPSPSVRDRVLTFHKPRDRPNPWHRWGVDRLFG